VGHFLGRFQEHLEYVATGLVVQARDELLDELEHIAPDEGRRFFDVALGLVATLWVRGWQLLALRSC